ncbi:MAG: endonuclease [Flavobacteriia bacterium]|jgi:putative endonuclease|nr:endonuclease [Flavobacteriia bacterium]
MTQAHQLGKKAENLAADYLQQLGYTLLAKNYRYLKAEVDLIVRKQNTLVGVEVKARSAGFKVAPHEAVSYKKINLLVEALDHFVQSRDLVVEVRFDLITYVFHGDLWEREHIKNAFYPFG